MILSIVLGALGGAVLAAAFLGGLWLMVRRQMATSGPGLSLALGSLARIALVAAGFVVITRLGGPIAVASAFVAFMAVRTVIIRRIRADGGARA